MNEQLPFYWKSRDAYNKADRLLLDQLKRTEDAAVLLQLGQLRLAMEDYSEAESYLARAIEKDKDSPEAYQTLGVVCTRKERYEKAIKCFEDSLKRDPDNLTVRSNLAEAYYKAKKVDKAEAEFRRILEITPNHVESLIGLGEVYTLIAEDGDGDMYDRAIMYFSRGKKTGEQGEGSKKLKKKDLAALLYSRGYARIKLYEAPKIQRDEKQLSEAERDFDECVRNDPEHHKARRALEKVRARRRPFSAESLREGAGPWVIAILAFSILVITQSKFVLDYPKGKKPTTIGEATPKQVASVEQKSDRVDAPSGKDTKHPSQPKKLSSIGKLEAPKPATLESTTKEADATKAKAEQVSKDGDEYGNGAISAGYYALLTFGSLIFMVAGLYLPQILKLKVAGIELEKSSVDQIGTGGTLGIRK